MPQPPAAATAEHVQLGDGIELLVRAVRPDDKRRIAHAFEQLSSESRYRRFFAPLERLLDQPPRASRL